MSRRATSILSGLLLGISLLAGAADDPRGLKAVYAETRVALVIGNGAYAVSPLNNPPHDAATWPPCWRNVASR